MQRRLRVEALEDRTLLSVTAESGGPPTVPPWQDYVQVGDQRVNNFHFAGLAQLYVDYLAAGEDFDPSQTGFQIRDGVLGIGVECYAMFGKAIEPLEAIGMEVEYYHAGSVCGRIPIDALDELFALPFVFEAREVPDYLDIRKPWPDTFPPQMNVGEDLAWMYVAYKDFMEAGGNAGDFVSEYTDQYRFDGDKVFVQIDFSGSYEAGVAAAERLGFEVQGAFVRGGIARGYVPIGQVRAVAAVDAVGHISAVGVDAPTFSEIREEFVLRQFNEALRAVYEEYQAHVRGGGQPEQFVSARSDLHFRGDRLLVRIRVSGDFEAAVNELEALGLETTYRSEKNVEGYFPLAELEELALAEVTDYISASADPYSLRPFQGKLRLGAREVYEEYRAFTEGGGRAEDFVSARSDLHFRADRLLVRLTVFGDCQAAVNELEALGLELTHWVDRRVEGYFPLSELDKLALAEVTEYIWADAYAYTLQPFQGKVDWETLKVYEEYRAFIEGGGRAEDFVPAQTLTYDVEGNRIKLRVRLNGDRQAAAEAIEALGMRWTDVSGPQYSYGYLPLPQLEALAAARHTANVCTFFEWLDVPRDDEPVPTPSQPVIIDDEAVPTPSQPILAPRGPVESIHGTWIDVPPYIQPVEGAHPIIMLPSQPVRPIGDGPDAEETVAPVGGDADGPLGPIGWELAELHLQWTAATDHGANVGNFTPSNRMLPLRGDGVAYFSAAGNEADPSYESQPNDSGIVYTNGQFSSVQDAPQFMRGTAHDFDPGAGIDVWQQFTLGSGDTITLDFEWVDPLASVIAYPGSSIGRS